MWCDIFSIVTHTSSRLCICDSIAICKILQKALLWKESGFQSWPRAIFIMVFNPLKANYLLLEAHPKEGQFSLQRSLYFSPSTNFKVIQKHMGSPLVPKGKGDPVAIEVLATIAVSYTWHTSNEASEMQIVIRCVKTSATKDCKEHCSLQIIHCVVLWSQGSGWKGKVISDWHKTLHTFQIPHTRFSS